MTAAIIGCGWQVATFALAHVRQAEGHVTSSTAVWHTYVAWCRRQGHIPLSHAVFFEAFQTLAEQVGNPGIWSEGLVNYWNMRLLSDKEAAGVDG